MDCGCRVLTSFSYLSCWAVFSAQRFTCSGTKTRSFTLHWYYVWVEIIQHPNYMLSKISSILIMASWMHNTAAWGFVFPGMSAIRHQSLVCQGCGSPVDKKHRALLEDYQRESYLGTTLCSMWYNKFRAAMQEKVRSQNNFCRPDRE